MRNSKVVKAISLTSSITLVTLFIIYRGGYLDSIFYQDNSAIQTSHNGGAISSSQKSKSIIKKDSTAKVSTMLSSSKSIVLTDDRKIKYDTVKPQKDSLNIKPSSEELTIMASSKSSMVFHPSISYLDILRYKKSKPKAKKRKTPKKK